MIIRTKIIRLKLEFILFFINIHWTVSATCWFSFTSLVLPVEWASNSFCDKGSNQPFYNTFTRQRLSLVPDSFFLFSFFFRLLFSVFKILCPTYPLSILYICLNHISLSNFGSKLLHLSSFSDVLIYILVQWKSKHFLFFIYSFIFFNPVLSGSFYSPSYDLNALLRHKLWESECLCLCVCHEMYLTRVCSCNNDP